MGSQRAEHCRLAGQSVRHHSISSVRQRASEKDKQEGGFNPALLLFAPVVAFGLSVVTWVASLFAGAASLTAVSLGVTLVAVLFIGTQVAGFTVLATFLALSSLLLKVATVALPIAILYIALGGKMPVALPWEAQESSRSATNSEVAATSERQGSIFDDWDTRFAASNATSASQRERLRFEDLSPFSPPAKLQAFIVQEQLDISTESDKAPLALYREIAVELAKGRRKRA